MKYLMHFIGLIIGYIIVVCLLCAITAVGASIVYVFFATVVPYIADSNMSPYFKWISYSSATVVFSVTLVVLGAIVFDEGTQKDFINMIKEFKIKS